MCSNRTIGGNAHTHACVSSNVTGRCVCTKIAKTKIESQAKCLSLVVVNFPMNKLRSIYTLFLRRNKIKPHTGNTYDLASNFCHYFGAMSYLIVPRMCQWRRKNAPPWLYSQKGQKGKTIAVEIGFRFIFNIYCVSSVECRVLSC